MKLIPLSQVKHFLHAGATLPWGVRDGNGVLLLAKGHLVQDSHALETLLDRGMFVDEAEAVAVARAEAPKEEEDLNTLWSGLESRLGTVLRSAGDPFFLERINDAVSKILRMVEGNVDQIISLIMCHDHSRLANYGVTHSLHTAALCGLLSKRLDWPDARRRSVVGAALTMNISMVDLQGILATSGSKPTEKERALINCHSTDSADLLRKSGLDDVDWIEAVEQHHEEVGGTGYPAKLQQPGDLARLIHVVDCFTAKHSPRAGRVQQPAQTAARNLYIQSTGDSFAGLLIKEVGINPPGCYVKLASGEMAIVIHRGATANTPVVAAITNKNGDPLALPQRRDTSNPAHAILTTVPENSVMVRVAVESFYTGNKR